jgi:succinate-semialdehyde dehydrogenase / glutarate-semialdehyde dehydrogenase
MIRDIIFIHFNMQITTINPYTLQQLADYQTLSSTALDKKLEISAKAFQHWRQIPMQQRAEKFLKIATHLRENHEKYANLITAEMGKILRESEAEIEKCAAVCEHYPKFSEGYLADKQVVTKVRKSFVAYEPLGTILGIMPWNFPFWQALRFAIPSMIAGNVILLKHAPNVWGSALELEKIFLETGFPEGVFQTLLIDLPDVEYVLQSPIVHGVSLTGSNRAGASVASLAGKYVKKSVLELGGSDPLIVLKDADLQKAATVAVQSRFQNAGQTCIAAKRYIVEKSVKDEFTHFVLNKISALKQGNPLLPETNLGPLARLDLADNLSRQLTDSQALNAKLLFGGNHENCNFQPTLLDNITPENVVFQEETFGPLACLIEAKDENDAVRLANLSPYGLGAAIWTADYEKAERLARQIESGSVYVNALMRSDARMPFGGVKNSGYGRELAEIGMHEFVNVKSIWIE